MNAEFWNEISRQELEQALLSQKMNTNAAKNIILFLGKWKIRSIVDIIDTSHVTRCRFSLPVRLIN